MKFKFTKKTIICMVVVFGAIILPVFYSYFYLGAFWDPYSKLNDLPVAVVNNDQGAVINGKQRNVGEEMCDNLKESGDLKFIFTNYKEAKSGTQGKDYYAMIVIPEDFSKDIASVNSTDKQTATITYSPNQKRNFLASQILNSAVKEIEKSVRSNINKEIVTELASQLNAIPSQMTELQSGIKQIYDGSSQLSEGSQSLAEGSAAYSNKFNEYQSGVSSIKDGSNTLSNGLSALNSGINALLNGANTLTASTANIETLSSGAQSLAAGTATFNDSLIQYTAGVDQLIGSLNSITGFLTNYATNINPAIMSDPYFAGFMTKLAAPENIQNIQTLQEASTTLKAASAQIAANTKVLAEGTRNLPQLKSALTQLSQNLAVVESSSAQLASGSQTLYNGISQLDSGAAQLGDAASDIADGAADLNNGAADLNSGIGTASSSIDSSISNANEELESLNGLADYAENPVSFEEEDINHVPNYGTGFAPYFMSLSLWVGAIIIFVGIYLDPDNKFKILSSYSSNKVARSFMYLLMGFAQAIILGLVVKLCLGLKVENLLLYFSSCCLVSLVFIAIVQFFIVFLKDAGKFISLLLLILQLTSCGGTFPMETVPKIFNVLYPYMPMTYSVGLFKQAISGVETSAVLYNAGILGAMLIIFMALTLICSIIKVKHSNEYLQQKELPQN